MHLDIKKPIILKLNLFPVFLIFDVEKLVLSLVYTLISVRILMASRPQFSARAMGTTSKASAKARNAYCSIVLMLSA